MCIPQGGGAPPPTSSTAALAAAVAAVAAAAKTAQATPAGQLIVPKSTQEFQSSVPYTSLSAELKLAMSRLGFDDQAEEELLSRLRVAQVDADCLQTGQAHEAIAFLQRSLGFPSGLARELVTRCREAASDESGQSPVLAPPQLPSPPLPSPSLPKGAAEGTTAGRVAPNDVRPVSAMVVAGATQPASLPTPAGTVAGKTQNDLLALPTAATAAGATKAAAHDVPKVSEAPLKEIGEKLNKLDAVQEAVKWQGREAAAADLPGLIAATAAKATCEITSTPAAMPTKSASEMPNGNVAVAAKATPAPVLSGAPPPYRGMVAAGSYPVPLVTTGGSLPKPGMAVEVVSPMVNSQVQRSPATLSRPSWASRSQPQIAWQAGVAAVGPPINRPDAALR